MILVAALERTGDFSQSGITIYDPLTTRANPNGTGFIRDSFPGNKIPLNRLNPIALQYLTGVPLPQTGRSYTASATLDDGPQNQETFKLDQRWNAKWTTTGMYGHQKTKEPSSAFFGELGTVPVDPGGGINGSTFNSNAFKITNNSTGGVTITSVRFDLSTALLPDVVFDPFGTAGDTVAKGFTPDSRYRPLPEGPAENRNDAPWASARLISRNELVWAGSSSTSAPLPVRPPAGATIPAAFAFVVNG